MELLDVLHLPGPQFLAFYAAVVVAVLAGAAFAIVSADRSDGQQPQHVPTNPDPIELAYLKGGTNQALRTLIYDLCRRGHLRLQKEESILPGDQAPPGDALTPLEAALVRAVGAGVKIAKIFSDKRLAAEAERILAPVRMRLLGRELLRPDGVVTAGCWSFGLGALLLGGLALAKIRIGLQLQRPVDFLIALSIVGLVFLMLLTIALCSRRTSKRGRAYLKDVRSAYSGRIRDALRNFHAASIGPSTSPAATTAAVLLLVGLDGFNALKGTPDAIFAKAFAQGSNGGGGCGSSCGGGGGDGGGGCGGCGG
jgi:uncharacterized protein (TIGR04222 family)